MWVLRPNRGHNIGKFSVLSSKRQEKERVGSLLHLGAALAYLQARIALANHIDTTAATNHFTVLAAVF